MKKIISCFSFLIFLSPILNAQLPNCDVWLFDFSISAGQYVFHEGENISNHKGYDNQPSFSENGSYLLWTANRDSNETDIFRYEPHTHTTLRVTQTGFSEYSPTFMPGNKYISAVVVEKDSIQRLWKYNKISGASSVILPKVYGVGYHCWFDENTVFLFEVTTPATLVLADVRTGANKTIIGNVGRCMQTYHGLKRKMLLYTVPDTSGFVWIMALDGLGNKISDFTPIKGLKDSQDFVVDNLGNIFMAQGSSLYTRKVEGGADADWNFVKDFSLEGMSHITRMAISGDGHHFAFVDNPK